MFTYKNIFVMTERKTLLIVYILYVFEKTFMYTEKELKGNVDYTYI